MTTIPRVYIGPQPRVRIAGIPVHRGVATDLPADLESAQLVDATLWAALGAVNGLTDGARTRVARMLAGRDVDDVDDEELTAIDGVGAKTAKAIRRHVNDPPPPPPPPADDAGDEDASSDEAAVTGETEPAPPTTDGDVGEES